MTALSSYRLEADRSVALLISLDVCITIVCGLMFPGALWGVVLGQVLVVVSMVRMYVNSWRQRERALSRDAQTQLLLMTARAEKALQSGEVIACSTCQRPIRRAANARCLFCGAGYLPSLR